MLSLFCDNNAAGACGYGSSATTLYGPNLAAAVPSIYKDGAGCGSCLQIRCKEPKLCSKNGTKVIVTDLNQDKMVDFVMSSSAFMSMAKKGMSKDVLKVGIVNVEYKRVEESSKNLDYLAIKLLYQGGQTEITVVYVAPVDGPAILVNMRRSYGAVGDTSRAPKGALGFGFRLQAGYEGAWSYADNALPADWKVGDIYDTGLQINAPLQRKFVFRVTMEAGNYKGFDNRFWYGRSTI